MGCGANSKAPTGTSWRAGTRSAFSRRDGDFMARRHTISVQPAQRVSFLVTADALGGWAWHCHILYHMDAGMFRQVVVA